MAIPEIYLGANINPDTHTFAAWLNRTNQISAHMANLVVTVDSSAIGGQTTGNAQIVGTMGATIIATPTIKGGTVNGSGPVTIVSNLVTNEHVVFSGGKNITANSATISLTSAVLTSNSAAHTFTGANTTVVATNLSLTGSGSFNLTGNVVSAGGVLINGPYLNANAMFTVSTGTDMNIVRPLVAADGLTSTTIVASGLTTLNANTTVNGQTFTHTGAIVSDSAGSVTIVRPLVASNTTTMTGAMTANNTATFAGNVTVQGGATFFANVTGIATLTGQTASVVKSANVYLETDATHKIHQNSTSTTIQSGTGVLTVAAATTLVAPTSLAITSPAMAVSSNTTVNGRTFTHTGAIVSDNAGSVTISRPLVAANTSTLNGALTVNALSTLAGNVLVQGGATLTANVTGAVSIKGSSVNLNSANITIDTDATHYMKVDAAAVVSVSGNTKIEAFSANSTIDVTAPTSVNLVTPRFTVASILTANATGNVDIVRPVNITGALNTAAVSIGSTLQVTGTTTLNGSVSVTAPITITANVTMTANTLTMTDVMVASRTGNVTFSRPVVANSGATLSAVTVSGVATLNGNVVANSTSLAWNSIFEATKTTDFIVHRPMKVNDMITANSANVINDMFVGGELYVNGGINIASNIALTVNASVSNTLTVMTTANIARLTGVTVIDIARMGPVVAALPTNDGNFSFVANRGLVVHRANAAAIGTYTVWDTSNVEAGDNIVISGNGVNALTGKISISVSGGPGSGLHADLLDGQQGSYYLDAGNLTGTLPGSVFPTNVVLTTGNQTLGGVKTFSSEIVGSVSGSAATLKTARNINGVSFNGSGNIDVPTRFVKAVTAANTFPIAFAAIDQATLTGQADGTATVIATSIHPSVALQTNTGTVFANHFNMTSDRDLKENIHTIENALDKVDRLRGVTFDWIETGAADLGVIAQEVEEVIPEAVQMNGDIKTVAFGSLMGLLIESIKDLKGQVEELKVRVDALDK